MVHGFLMCASMHAWKLFVFTEYIESADRSILGRKSLSKRIALVWQETFKACWKHSHENKESFIKSKLALFYQLYANTFLVLFYFFKTDKTCFVWLLELAVFFEHIFWRMRLQVPADSASFWFSERVLSGAKF